MSCVREAAVSRLLGAFPGLVRVLRGGDLGAAATRVRLSVYLSSS